MPKLDKRVDAYIQKSPEFARPVLKKLRATWHKACPDIEETIKWGVPYFTRNGLVGGIAAFKSHVAVAFWKAKQLKDPAGILKEGATLSACRIHGLDDMPREQDLVACIREAVALNEAGKGRRERKPVKVPPLPADFADAMRRDRRAVATFENFPPSEQREYVEWITEANQAATRARRITQAVEWLAEGKRRHWKYLAK
ncbi:MAG TPA: YdeI/OmpD-associated family protein [Gammaproteobacteria bacterium]